MIRFGRACVTVRRNWSRSRSISASRPTNAAATCSRATPGAEVSRSTSKTRKGRSIPFTDTPPRSTKENASRASRYVRSPTTTRPGSASVWKRAATFTASPVTIPSSIE